MLIRSIRSLLATVFAAVAIMIVLVTTGAPEASAQQSGDIIPGRFVVTFENGVPPGLLATSLAQRHGFRILHIYQNTFSGMAIQVGPGRETGVLASLRGDADVRSIGNDRYSSIVAQTYPKGLNRIDGVGGSAGSANDGSGIDVAVVDTGVDTGHADLAGRIDSTRSVSCLTTGEDSGCRTFNDDGSIAYEDDHGHGTFVSGIIAANDNAIDIVGIVPEATIIAVKVCNSVGLCPDADMTAGFDYLAGLVDKAEVANVSIGGPCGGPCTDTTDPLLVATHTAIAGLVSAGTTVVVAAGNESTDATNISPAALDEVVTVSALADWDGEPGGNGGSMIFIGSGKWNDDSFAKFSNYGDPIDVIAPGVLEVSLLMGGGTTTSSGTSFSAPHAAGVAAVYIRNYMDSHFGDTPSPALVKQALIETGECREGDGTVIHGGVGCTQVWSGDPDGVAEPMVRADNVVTFAPPLALDVATTSVSVVKLPILDGEGNSVDVTVTNNGTSGTGDFSVSLTDDLALVSTQGGVTLSAGETAVLNFEWMPSGVGDHVLEASHDFADDDDSNDTASSTVAVQTAIHDAATLSVSAPASVSQGTIVDVAVDVKNTGTYDETFDVTLSDDGVAVDTLPAGTLTPGTQTTLHFDWDTTSASQTVHVLSATQNLVGDKDGSNDTAQTNSEVTAPVIGPSIDSITPDEMLATDPPLAATIAGSGFGTEPADVTVTFQNGSGPAPTASVTSVTAEAIQVTISVKEKGKKGVLVWDLVVTTLSGSDVLLDAFTFTR